MLKNNCMAIILLCPIMAAAQQSPCDAVRRPIEAAMKAAIMRGDSVKAGELGHNYVLAVLACEVPIKVAAQQAASMASVAQPK